ncbi:MAG: hypothetical protein GWQ05_09405 [Verrucomicrobiaceae bacterium]|nr:hypothetical protein [Verrucomicrobiaceae bacterium]
MEFTEEELVEFGWHDTATYEALLEKVVRLSAKGNDHAYILKRLSRIHPRHEPTMAMREEAIAIKRLPRKTRRRISKRRVEPCGS